MSESARVRILHGDCREVLKTLPDASVTSPPYFGLRDYGTGTWQGGDSSCTHVVGEMRRGANLAASQASTRGGAVKAAHVDDIKARSICPLCGALRIDLQIGMEATPAEYVAELVAVFRDVRRVLREDGTLWLNLGDSYSASTKGSSGSGKNARNEGIHLADRAWHVPPGLKPKDLIGIPWHVAFALQADGWYLRQDIIWSKPNPMPESVTDRCTKAHEYVFLLSKSARYYYDARAIAEPSAPSSIARTAQDVASQAGSDRVPGKTNGPMKAVRAKRDSFRRDGSKRVAAMHGQAVGTHRPDREGSDYPVDMRNKRSVWTIATQGFSEAHFATMAPELAETCIKAGCPVDGVVLDPFGGAGTTGLVADRLQRNALLIELNPAYSVLARNRIVADGPLFADVDIASPAEIAP